MFKVLLSELNVTISINSNDPDTPAILEFEGDRIVVATLKKQLAGMYGMYYHGTIGDATAPLDLDHALVTSKLKFEILEGADILKMPRQELPPGAVW